MSKLLTKQGQNYIKSYELDIDPVENPLDHKAFEYPFKIEFKAPLGMIIGISFKDIREGIKKHPHLIVEHRDTEPEELWTYKVIIVRDGDRFSIPIGCDYVGSFVKRGSNYYHIYAGTVDTEGVSGIQLPRSRPNENL